MTQPLARSHSRRRRLPLKAVYEVTDHAVDLNVDGTGIGIVEEMKNTLFKPLTTGKAKGTGLGLAVVKRIVDAHGGTISFEGQEGEGTTFMVTLPPREV